MKSKSLSLNNLKEDYSGHNSAGIFINGNYPPTTLQVTSDGLEERRNEEIIYERDLSSE